MRQDSDDSPVAGTGASGPDESADSSSAPAARGASRPFRIDVDRQDGSARVAPVGELDLVTAPQVDERLDELRKAGVRGLVLDLRQLTFSDSSGLHLALKWDLRASENGIEFALIDGRASVRRLFEITGVRDRLAFREA